MKAVDSLMDFTSISQLDYKMLLDVWCTPLGLILDLIRARRDFLILKMKTLRGVTGIPSVGVSALLDSLW